MGSGRAAASSAYGRMRVGSGVKWSGTPGPYMLRLLLLYFLGQMCSFLGTRRDEGVEAIDG